MQNKLLQNPFENVGTFFEYFSCYSLFLIISALHELKTRMYVRLPNRDLLNLEITRCIMQQFLSCRNRFIIEIKVQGVKNKRNTKLYKFE